jgi:hypothetical protein
MLLAVRPVPLATGADAGGHAPWNRVVLAADREVPRSGAGLRDRY